MVQGRRTANSLQQAASDLLLALCRYGKLHHLKMQETVLGSRERRYETKEHIQLPAVRLSEPEMAREVSRLQSMGYSGRRTGGYE
jgi:hypothetical protein